MTSMEAKDHFLYAAVKGTIICLNCATMEIVKTFHPYHRTTRSLLVINYSASQSRFFDKLVSRTELPSIAGRSHSLEPTPSPSPSPSTDSLKSFSSFRKTSNSSLNLDDEPCNSIMASFGVGFQGVVKDHTNHPEHFILPSEGNRNNFQVARPKQDAWYLLLWSTETYDKKPELENPAKDTIPEVDEDEEGVLPDDMVSAY